MIAGFFQRLASVVLWGGLCGVFTFFVSSGAIFLGAFILALLFGIIAVMLGPQFLAAGWLVGSPTIFGFPNEILRGLPFVTMERLIFATLVIVLFMRHVFTREKTRWLPLEVAIVFFLGYALINLVLSTSEYTYRRDGWLWVQYLMPMAGFIISRRISWTDRNLKILLAALTLTGVFIAFSGAAQSILGINVLTMNYQSIAPGHTGRAYGTFSNAHTYVATLFIFLTISLLQYNLYKDEFIRFCLLGAMAVIAIGIILGATRAPWIGAALGMLIIFKKHLEARPVILVGGFIAFFLLTIVAILSIDSLGGMIERVTNIRTLQGRAATWATALNMIADNPVFGTGFGAATFAANKLDYISGIGSLGSHFAMDLGVPHNEYLHVAVLLGVVGLVLFVLILTRMVRLMFQIFDDDRESELRRHLALYTGAIIIALMFNSFFSDTYIQDYFWPLTYFLAGVAAGNLQRADREQVSVEQGGRHAAAAGR